MWHVEFAQPGIEPMPPVLEAQNLNHWITRLSPRNKHIKKKKKNHSTKTVEKNILLKQFLN